MSPQTIPDASSVTLTTSSLLNRAVEIQEAEDGLPFGSGILIEPQWVLTAAHLIATPKLGYCAPVWVRNKATGLTKEAFWWRQWEAPVDLAMLYLGDQVQIPGSVVPIEDSDLKVDTRGWIAGYGQTAGELITREFKVLSPHCAESGEAWAHGCHPTMHVVIRGLTEKDLLHLGDSGAPFVVQTQDGTPRLAGIVRRQSSGFKLRKYLAHFAHLLFGKSYVHTMIGGRDGVCTRVDVHKAWIAERPSHAELEACTPSPYAWVTTRLRRFRDRVYF
jgi:hypothetical protein